MLVLIAGSGFWKIVKLREKMGENDQSSEFAVNR